MFRLSNFTSTAEVKYGGCCHSRRLIMGSTTDKIHGAANKVAGTLKEGVGEAVGNPKLQVEGAAQKLKGEAQEAVGHAKDVVKKVIDKG